MLQRGQVTDITIAWSFKKVNKHNQIYWTPSNKTLCSLKCVSSDETYKQDGITFVNI